MIEFFLFIQNLNKYKNKNTKTKIRRDDNFQKEKKNLSEQHETLMLNFTQITRLLSNSMHVNSYIREGNDTETHQRKLLDKNKNTFQAKINCDFSKVSRTNSRLSILRASLSLNKTKELGIKKHSRPKEKSFLLRRRS